MAAVVDLTPTAVTVATAEPPTPATLIPPLPTTIRLQALIMLTVIATRDFRSSVGLHVAGTIVATIDTQLTSGELASLLRTRSDIAVESDADDETASQSETPDQSETTDNDQDGEEHVDPMARSLADLIESKPAKLLAENDPSITTVGELAAWIALGNRPSQVSGIGPTTESEILAATGLKS